jgi:hypothetical protein
MIFSIDKFETTYINIISLAKEFAFGHNEVLFLSIINDLLNKPSLELNIPIEAHKDKPSSKAIHSSGHSFAGSCSLHKHFIFGS